MDLQNQIKVISGRKGMDMGPAPWKPRYFRPCYRGSIRLFIASRGPPCSLSNISCKDPCQSGPANTESWNEDGRFFWSPNGWWFQFSPQILGEMIQFDENMFQLGWNHQLEEVFGRFWKTKAMKLQQKQGLISQTPGKSTHRIHVWYIYLHVH